MNRNINEILTIDTTNKTPYIYCDKNKGLIEIKGRSNPENTNIFYEPLFIWYEKYHNDLPESIYVNLQLEYLNSSSSNVLMIFFDKLNVLHKRGIEILVNWVYEEDDDDMNEHGKDLESKVGFKFNFIAIG